MKILGIILSLFTLSASAQTQENAFSQPPVWSKNAIWYQIFVERFCNGDSNNDPKPENVNVPPLNMYVPDNWAVTPWTQNWYKQDDWAINTGKPLDEAIQFRKYGGDLQGVINKLDYLKELGINALFINPINDAPSMHKYDARHYHHVDVNFGADPLGDIKLMASENPADPTTWQWTSADKLFLQLIAAAHQRNMKIIIDYSWNHTGTLFWAWQDIIKNQEKSLYKDWYDVTAFDNPATAVNEFAYNGWLGIESLPELKKVNITTPRTSGYPYEGNLNEAAKAHVFAVTQRWLAPNGDTSKGIDGFRLDVADQLGLGFWRDFRKFVRAIQPEAYLVGEIWWEDWPDRLMSPEPYTKGDIFDAVMFYQVYRPARYFFARNDFSIDAKTFKDSLEMQWHRAPEANRYAMMNVSSSHDAPRLLSDFYNPNKYKFKAKPRDDLNYKTGKPDEETYQRLRLYLVHLFTTIGAPQIWNGEEMGMWGADDPHNRKPLWWKDLKFEPETNNFYQSTAKTYDSVAFNQPHFDFYKRLIKIRKDNPVLSNGKIDFLYTESKKLIYKRYDTQNEILVLFNLEDNQQNLPIPAGKYIDLLTNKKVAGTSILVNAKSAFILKKVNKSKK